MTATPDIGALVRWNPASNAERTAVTRFGRAHWRVERITPSFRGPSLAGQACAMLVPVSITNEPIAEGRRWVPLAQIEA